MVTEDEGQVTTKRSLGKISSRILKIVNGQNVFGVDNINYPLFSLIIFNIRKKKHLWKFLKRINAQILQQAILILTVFDTHTSLKSA